MSNYDHRLVITIPPELLLVGKAIARAMDNDVGGYESYNPVTDGETIVAYVADTPCTAGFYEQALYMLANPEVLHRAVSDDYFVRWADLDPPTLQECQDFCANVVLVLPDAEGATNGSTGSGSTDSGLAETILTEDGSTA